MYTYKDFQVALSLLPKSIRNKVKDETARKMGYANSRVMASANCRISDRELSQNHLEIFLEIVELYKLDTKVIHSVSNKDVVDIASKETQPLLFQDELFNKSVKAKVSQLKEQGESTLLSVGEEYLATYDLYKILEQKLKRLSKELEGEI